MLATIRHDANLIPQNGVGLTRSIPELRTVEDEVVVEVVQSEPSLEDLLVVDYSGIAQTVMSSFADVNVEASTLPIELYQPKTYVSSRLAVYEDAMHAHTVSPVHAVSEVRYSEHAVTFTSNDVYQSSISIPQGKLYEFSKPTNLARAHEYKTVKKVKTYVQEGHTREDQHNVTPVAYKTKIDDQCARVATTQSQGDMYRLVLKNRMYDQARLVRVGEREDAETVVAERRSVFSGLDAVLNATGLIPIYERTAEGIQLKEIKGLYDVGYVVQVREKTTGRVRSVSQSIDEAVFDPFTEQIELSYVENDMSSIDFSSWYSSDFTQVKGVDGACVEGGYELLQYKVTDADVADTSIKTLHGYDEHGQAKQHDVVANCEQYVMHKALVEAGLTPEYQICDFILKDGSRENLDGSKIVRAVRLYRVAKDGQEIVFNEKDTGYLIERVDVFGQRSEALDEFGIALKSEEARGRVGQILSLVNVVQGRYDRRKTLHAYERN